MALPWRVYGSPARPRGGRDDYESGAGRAGSASTVDFSSESGYLPCDRPWGSGCSPFFGCPLHRPAIGVRVGHAPGETNHMAWWDDALDAAGAAVGVVGSFAGQKLGQRLPQATLRRLFGALLVVMGIFIAADVAPQLLH